ncbi:uncharacterized protein LOC123504012 [Portunus trituberculatus]|uniref:uncharacterized protein LOC123500188 n=1 Tax=Portunus trituberculatus TaxID=210409 RepID=UPI001E1CC516|nr:uncharacterized protein LOC123500188 [Portunus trituberculatus]XP_045110148.1 uncharacterized protein LOC123504012 [Portunus trituberculatus]
MTNWTDEGRIELAKQYALDSAYTHMTHCATQHKNDWDDVRKAFLDIYPEDRSLPSLISELSSVTRQPRETITELYIRVEGIVAKLESMKPTDCGAMHGIRSSLGCTPKLTSSTRDEFLPRPSTTCNWTSLCGAFFVEIGGYL